MSTYQDSLNELQRRQRAKINAVNKAFEGDFSYLNSDISKSEDNNLSFIEENTLFKSKPANIYDIHIWNGKKMRKQPNGKWMEVSESHGMTKKEHSEKGKEHKYNSAMYTNKRNPKREEQELSKWEEHNEIASKLSDKEHSDEEVGLGKEKENKIKVGDFVKIPKDLTTDPMNKQGEKGKISSIHKDYIVVRFEDGSSGMYDSDIFN